MIGIFSHSMPGIESEGSLEGGLPESFESGFSGILLLAILLRNPSSRPARSPARPASRARPRPWNDRPGTWIDRRLCLIAGLSPSYLDPGTDLRRSLFTLLAVLRRRGLALGRRTWNVPGRNCRQVSPCRWSAGTRWDHSSCPSPWPCPTTVACRGLRRGGSLRSGPSPWTPLSFRTAYFDARRSLELRRPSHRPQSRDGERQDRRRRRSGRRSGWRRRQPGRRHRTRHLDLPPPEVRRRLRKLVASRRPIPLAI